MLTLPIFSQCVGTGCPGTGGGASGVSSFNSRTGAVLPVLGSDYPITVENASGAPTYTVVVGDQGQVITNSNLGVIRLPVPSGSFISGWHVYVVANTLVNSPILFSGTCSCNINGGLASNFSLNSNSSALLISTGDGTNWIAINGNLFPFTPATSSTNGGFGGVNAPQTGQQDLPLTGNNAWRTSTTGRFTAQTAAKTVLTMTSTVGADATYLVSSNILVTAATTASFTTTVSYTDESSTAQTLTLPFTGLTGIPLTTITNVTGTGPYEGIPVHIRCKANTTITVVTVGTFTSVTYNVESHIRHIL